MSVEEIIDRLYGLPLDEFTAARNQAERELRKAGERDQADTIKALRKPTAGAAAVNRLVRGHQAQVEAFLAASVRLRDAQVAGKGEFASATRDYREALETLVGLGGEPVRASLEAAAVDDESAHELLRARLLRELEPAGFGSLSAHAVTPPGEAPASPSQTAKHGPKRAEPDDSAARARLREARKALMAATGEERQARRRWGQTQRKLEAAQAAVESAERQLDRLRGR